MPLNFEFKARSSGNSGLEERLLELNPVYAGMDHQTDTYFPVPHGRLKLREGNIENALIHYKRENTPSTKQSEVLLCKLSPDPALKKVLAAALGQAVIVQKKRRIYFLGNIKFHFDEVEGLGSFIEVEAIDTDGALGVEELKNQCRRFVTFFGIRDEDFVAESYCDLASLEQQS